MKKFAIAVLLSSSLPFAASASIKASENVKFKGDMEYASFCEAVINDDLKLFKVALSTLVGDLGYSEKLVLKRVSTKNGVKCSGQDLIKFSQERNAEKVLSYIKSNRA